MTMGRNLCFTLLYYLVTLIVLTVSEKNTAEDSNSVAIHLYFPDVHLPDVHLSDFSIFTNGTKGIDFPDIHFPTIFSNETIAEIEAFLESVGTGAIIGSLLSLIFPFALLLAGFGCSGIIGGSFAALTQTPQVLSGSCFAVLQSVGACGHPVVFAINFLIWTSAGAITGGAKKIKWSFFKEFWPKLWTGVKVWTLKFFKFTGIGFGILVAAIVGIVILLFTAKLLVSLFDCLKAICAERRITRNSEVRTRIIDSLQNAEEDDVEILVVV